jgi:hypothetical protein
MDTPTLERLNSLLDHDAEMREVNFITNHYFDPSLSYLENQRTCKRTRQKIAHHDGFTEYNSFHAAGWQ